jgi:hypothetical protein
LTVHFDKKVVQPNYQGKKIVRVVKFSQFIQRLKNQVFISILGLIFYPQFLRPDARPFSVEKYVKVNVRKLLKNLSSLAVYD